MSHSHLPCHAMPCSDHAVLLKATAQHGRRETAVLCCGLEKNGMVRAWQGHCMASVNQTRPHCVNQMGKTRSKLLAARHGRGRAWARHGSGTLCVHRPLLSLTVLRLALASVRTAVASVPNRSIVHERIFSALSLQIRGYMQIGRQK
jgi:hypothetical protein